MEVGKDVEVKADAEAGKDVKVKAGAEIGADVKASTDVGGDAEVGEISRSGKLLESGKIMRLSFGGAVSMRRPLAVWTSATDVRQATPPGRHWGR